MIFVIVGRFPYGIGGPYISGQSRYNGLKRLPLTKKASGFRRFPGNKRWPRQAAVLPQPRFPLRPAPEGGRDLVFHPLGDRMPVMGLIEVEGRIAILGPVDAPVDPLARARDATAARRAALQASSAAAPGVPGGAERHVVGREHDDQRYCGRQGGGEVPQGFGAREATGPVRRRAFSRRSSRRARSVPRARSGCSAS